MNIVITQSMLFPWIGMLEQIKLADIIVHYDDVQFSKGSFTNRVQIKTNNGFKWMTIPLEKVKLSQKIEEVKISKMDIWKKKHLNLLEHNFNNTPFKQEALQLVYEVYSKDYFSISDLSRASMKKLIEYFELDKNLISYDMRSLNIFGSSSERVLNTVLKLKGKTYITGHGAKNYLDHKIFEKKNIEVKYMQYQKLPYPQKYGEFNPYISSLDLVANCGKEGKKFIVSRAVNWKIFLNH